MRRHHFTLIAGLALGTLAGSYVHGDVRAGTASKPCAVPTPTPASVGGATAGKLLAAYSGQQIGKASGFGIWDSPVFVSRAPLLIWARAAAIDPTKPATADSIQVSEEVITGFAPLGQVALGAGDPPVVLTARVPKDFCKVGCHIFIDTPTNIRWTVTVHTR